MDKINDIIANETSGIDYYSHKYLCDSGDRVGIDYDDNQNIEWKEYGETERHTNPINLKKAVEIRKNRESIFKFFLDGSRQTYKATDMSFGENIYPIVGGQVGVGCCMRINGQIKPLEAQKNQTYFLVSVPDKAFSSRGWEQHSIAKKLLNEINDSLKSKRGSLQSLYFSGLLIYNTNKDDKFMSKGIAKIHEFMVEKERELVQDLAISGKLDEDSYLIKDGSLDYQRVSPRENPKALNLSDGRVLNYYRRVVGVSKSFDPTKCLVKGGGSKSNIVAKLKLFAIASI